MRQPEEERFENNEIYEPQQRNPQNVTEELDVAGEDAANTLATMNIGNNAPPANATPRELREYLQYLRRRIGGPRQIREDLARQAQQHPIESEPGWDSDQQVLYRGHTPDYEPMEVEEVLTPQEQQQPMYPQRQVPFNIDLLFHGRLLNRAYVRRFIEVYGEPSIQTPIIINNRKLIGFRQRFYAMYEPIFDNNYDPIHDDDPDLGGKRKTRRRKHLRKTKKGKKSKKTKSKKTKSKKTKSRRK